MNTYRKNAVIMGALFIMTMIAGIIESSVVLPVLQGPINNFYPNETLVKTGALLILGMSIGIVGIATMFFSVLRKDNEIIAITYVSLRTIECVFLIVGAVVSLFLITLSQNYIFANAPDVSQFQTIRNLALAVRFSAFQIAMIILGFNSSLMFGYLFYQSRLFPRWLSAWGLIGYIMLLVSALLAILDIMDTIHGIGSLMYIPGGLFELIVFPLWLMVKGFNSSAIATVKNKPTINRVS